MINVRRAAAVLHPHHHAAAQRGAQLGSNSACRELERAGPAARHPALRGEHERLQGGLRAGLPHREREVPTAIDEIDKTITHLQKIEDALLSSENNLRLANNKAEDLSIKKADEKRAVRQSHVRRTARKEE